MSWVRVDGKSVPLDSPDNASAENVFEEARQSIVHDGRIITEVRIGGDTVVWQDGSSLWQKPLGPENQMDLETDYPVRVSAPLIARLAESMPTIAKNHRDVAEAVREQGLEATAATAQLLKVWTDIHHAINQVCVLHGIDVSESPWSGIVGSFNERFGKLQDALRELKESLELKDLVLAADLLEFELASLAEDFTNPLRGFEEELHRQFPASSAA